MIVENLADVYTELSILDRLLDAYHDNGSMDDGDQISRRDALRIVFEERFQELFRTVTAELKAIQRKAAA